MDRAFSILPKVLHKRGLAKHAQSAMTTHRVRTWLAARLPSLADSLRVTSLKEGVLTIECGHSVAANECRGVLDELDEFLKAEGGFPDGLKIKISRN